MTIEKRLKRTDKELTQDTEELDRLHDCMLGNDLSDIDQIDLNCGLGVDDSDIRDMGYNKDCYLPVGLY